MESIRRAARSRWRHYLPGVLLIAAMWSVLAAWIAWDRTTEIRRAEAASATLAETLAAHTRQVLTEAEQIAALVAREVRLNGLDTDLKGLRAAGLIPSGAFLQVALTDASGILRASTLDGYRPMDLSDREHVDVHLKGTWPSGALFISKPVTGRLSGRHSVQLSRAITAEDGRLLAVIVISVDPAYFTSLYKTLDIGEQGMVTILGTQDYVVRARRTQAAESVGDKLAASSPLRAAVEASPDGTFRAKSPIDGIDRISSYQILAPYPLAVVVGYATDDFLSSFRSRRDLLLLAGLFMTALIAVAEIRQVALWRRLAGSALREHAALAQESEKSAYLHALFKAIPDAAVAMAGGMLVDVNPRLAKLLGGEDESLHGQTPQWLAQRFFEADLSEDKDEKVRMLTESMTHVAPGRSWRQVFTLRTPAVSVFECRIEALEAPHSGAVMLVRDMTAQTQVDRMKSEFISTAAHELRTPTAGILGLAELLAADRVPDARKPSLYQMIRNQAQSLSDLVSDLLDLARIEARADKDFHLESFDAASVIHSAVERFPGIESRLTVRLPDAPVRIRGDFAQLETVIRNLVENCVKYSLAESPIALELLASDGAVLITVEDRGIGIGAEEQKRVFDKFYRVEKNGAIPGSGLGLALVKEIVQLHGGKVWLESKLGMGTKFSVTLPAQA